MESTHSDFTNLSLLEITDEIEEWGESIRQPDRRTSKDFTDSRDVIQIADYNECASSNDGQLFVSEQPAIDLEALAERCMDDFDLVVEVIESFCDQCLERVSTLERALCAGDAEKVTFELDFLSGASMNVGAQFLDASISRLADAAVQKDDGSDSLAARLGSSDSPQWQAAFADLVVEFQRAVQYWKAFRIQTGNDDPEDMASTLRLESFLATCAASDRMENLGSNWSATEDEMHHRQQVETMEDPNGWPGYSSELREHPDWNALEIMDVFFEDSKQMLAWVRECWIGGRRHLIKDAAEEMLTIASLGGLTTLSRKLKALVESSGAGLRGSHIDAVEQQLDASIAIWSSCKLKI